MHKGRLTKNYKIYFKSTTLPSDDSDTKDKIITQLDTLFEEVQTFEAAVSSKWWMLDKTLIDSLRINNSGDCNTMINVVDKMPVVSSYM